MPLTLTTEQVAALAPDASSAKAGRDLASPRKWPLLGGDDEVLWGLAQGSGKEPYQVQVLLSETAFKCSCPSRKFPCKHGLGLMFIASQQAAALTSKDRPAWVDEWLASRSARAEKAKERAEAKEAKPVDEAAQAKRRQKREGRVDEGVALLNQWLSDLVRRGLADSSLQAYGAWEDMAKRMVDMQASGLARRLRECGEAARSGAGSERRLMTHLGRLHLLLEAYRRRESLPPEWQGEIATQVGWTQATEDVLAEVPVADDWFVAGRTVVEEDRLITTTTWLHGLLTRRWAQLLRSTPAGAAAQTADLLAAGLLARGELCFYPGLAPVRALWKAPPATAPSSAATLPVETFANVLERHGKLRAENPWRSRTPFLLVGRPAAGGPRTALADEAGHSLAWRTHEEGLQVLMAISGAGCVPLCGWWDGEAVELLSAFDGFEWISFQRVTG